MSASPGPNFMEARSAGDTFSQIGSSNEASIGQVGFCQGPVHQQEPQNGTLRQEVSDWWPFRVLQGTWTVRGLRWRSFFRILARQGAGDDVWSTSISMTTLRMFQRVNGTVSEDCGRSQACNIPGYIGTNIGTRNQKRHKKKKDKKKKRHRNGTTEERRHQKSARRFRDILCPDLPHVNEQSEHCHNRLMSCVGLKRLIFPR